MLTIGSNLASPLFFFGNGASQVLPVGTFYVTNDDDELLVDDKNEFLTYEKPNDS